MPATRTQRMALAYSSRRSFTSSFANLSSFGLDFDERAVAGRGTHLNADLGIVKDSVFTSADGSEGHTGFFDLEDLQIRAGRLVALDDVQGLLRHGSRFARRRVVFAFCHGNGQTSPYFSHRQW